MNLSLLGKRLLEVGLVSTEPKAEHYANLLRNKGVDVVWPAEAEDDPPPPTDHVAGVLDDDEGSPPEGLESPHP
jgi:hypothetical protein